MKRLAFIIALLILPMVCNAQLSVKGQGDKMEKISSTRMGACSLYKHGERYMISAPTSNRYDKTFVLYLGEDKESACLTLRDLILLCDNIEKDVPVYIDNGTKTCSIHKGTMGTLAFFQDGFAGFASFSKMEFDKFLTALMPEL